MKLGFAVGGRATQRNPFHAPQNGVCWLLPKPSYGRPVVGYVAAPFTRASAFPEPHCGNESKTGVQNHEDTPPGTALEGLLLPQPPGKDYRLLKVLTQPAEQAEGTSGGRSMGEPPPEQFARWGNGRAPVFAPPPQRLR
jgi:hypothetical protein